MLCVVGGGVLGGWFSAVLSGVVVGRVWFGAV